MARVTVLAAQVSVGLVLVGGVAAAFIKPPPHKETAAVVPAASPNTPSSARGPATGTPDWAKWIRTADTGATTDEAIDLRGYYDLADESFNRDDWNAVRAAFNDKMVSLACWPNEEPIDALSPATKQLCYAAIDFSGGGTQTGSEADRDKLCALASRARIEATKLSNAAAAGPASGAADLIRSEKAIRVTKVIGAAYCSESGSPETFASEAVANWDSRAALPPSGGTPDLEALQVAYKAGEARSYREQYKLLGEAIVYRGILLADKCLSTPRSRKPVPNCQPFS